MRKWSSKAPAIVLFVFFQHIYLQTCEIEAATWCYACDSLKDPKCRHPQNEFFENLTDLVAYINTSQAASNIFAITSASYFKRSQNGTKALLLTELGDTSQYCTPGSYDQFAVNGSKACLANNSLSTSCGTSTARTVHTCHYRPTALRIVNCDVLLKDSPGQKQCLKLNQEVTINRPTGAASFNNIIRTCISRPVGTEAKDECTELSISFDGNVQGVRCSCNDNMCNTAPSLLHHGIVVLNIVIILALTYLIRI